MQRILPLIFILSILSCQSTPGQNPEAQSLPLHKPVEEKLPGNRVPSLSLGTSTCSQCFKPITSGQYITLKKKNMSWHKKCYDGSIKCSLTGLPIPPGTRIVRIGDEVFKFSDYEQAEKCSVSKLPLVNHGRFQINFRRGDKILLSYLGHTRKCVSCQDSVMDFTEVGDDSRSICNLCLISYETYKDDFERLVQEVRAFFREQGLKCSQVSVSLAGTRDGLSHILRGKCVTTTSSRGDEILGYKHRIRVLRFLDRKEATLVLAHEYTHALINEHKKDFDPAILEDTEGLCDFVAYRYSVDRGFPAYLQGSFERNTISLYREGFKRMKGRALGRALRELFPSSARR